MKGIRLFICFRRICFTHGTEDGPVSIEETNETKEKGKYIVVVPQEKIDTARTAIGKMFQEFQQSGGRPAAMACLSAYQNYPLVNDNVTISGQ
jgi:hypothetical protein